MCSPRCVLLAQNKDFRLDTMNFDAMSLSGDLLNRFYGNRKMIEFDDKKYFRDGKDYFNFKTVEETVSEENVTLNGTETDFELSIKQPGWKDDGSIVFYNYDSILKIKYNTSKEYVSLIKDLAKVERFLKFCANRGNISVENIFFELKNNDGKYEKVVEVFIPYMIGKEINKEILDYDVLKGHLNDIFNCLDKSDYVFSIIPENNKIFGFISNKDYCSVFSCFQSIYQYIHGNKENIDEMQEESKLFEIKEEIIPELNKIRSKYICKDRIKREFVERFIHIIETANLKLEKCINTEFEKNGYILEALHYKTRNKIKDKGTLEAVKHAISDRDDITHNKTIKLDDISIGIYEMIYKLNYVMILKYAGIENEKIEKTIKYLSINNII